MYVLLFPGAEISIVRNAAALRLVVPEM